MNTAATQPPTDPRCERNVGGASCAEGSGGRPADAVEQVDGRWFCQRHVAAAKAVASKRRDRGLGTCSIPGCPRAAAEQDGKCAEHRAGERAAGSTVVIVADGSGKGEHPYAPKPAVVYVAVFYEFGVFKVGKATPWTVGSRVRDAAQKHRVRQPDVGIERPITSEPTAWAVQLFGGESVLWAVSERVEHAAAGRLAHNVGAKSVDHTQGNEWFQHESIADVDWPTAFHLAIGQTLVFLGDDKQQAGQPNRVV